MEKPQIIEKLLKKKLDNIGGRFFGIEEYKNNSEFKNFVYKISKISLTHINTELVKLKKIISKNDKHYSKVGDKCIEVNKNYRHNCIDKCKVSELK